MRTVRLPNVHTSVATRCQYWWWGDPQVNKSEQVSRDGHLMLLAGLGLESEVQCIPGISHMKTSPPPCGQTDSTENITYPEHQ